MTADSFDDNLRASAFAYLEAVLDYTGGVVRSSEVADFAFEGVTVRLMGQQGIRKPRQLEAALSIRTAFASRPDQRPYDDTRGEDGYLRYKWRGDDGLHSDNRALRVAMQQRKPLIWFHGVADHVYAPIFPVWLVAEEPEQQQFVVAVDLEQMRSWQLDERDPQVLELRREYADRVIKERLHQRVFRERVLLAYADRCSLCNLKYRDLLDAAHIKPDRDGGEPVVINGIAMCKLHHAAYDRDLLAIKPDFRIAVRPDVLADSDGPTLKHGLQGVHGEKLILPTRRADRPSSELLAERYERFLLAG